MPTETVEAPPSKIVDHKPAVADTTTLLLRQPVTTTVPARPVLATSLLEMNRMGRPRRGVDYIVSLIFHSALLALLLVVPLYFAQGLHMNQFATTFLVAPPPPPPPPPPATAAQVAAQRPRTSITKGAIISPTVIPKQILMVKEVPLPADVSAGVVGGVPGGVPGGQIGGVLGGILGGLPRAVRPPAPKPLRPIRIGGDVKPPRLIYGPSPVYPAIAKVAHIQGDVIIDAIIDTRGNVVQMHFLSGPPLLMNAAMDAVSRWKYQPTLLNGEPVAVEFQVTVQFQLSQ